MQDEIGAVVGRGDLVLADGGVETRVMFDDTVPMDPVLGSASLLGTPSGRAALFDGRHLRALGALLTS